MKDYNKEKNFQDLINENKEIQKDICSILNIKHENLILKKEDVYINGITADFTLFDKQNVRSIAECKGGTINVTDYIRGIGQIFQYEYFAKNNLSLKNYKFADDFNTLFIFPDKVLRKNDFNVGLFNYPTSNKIIEINIKNFAVRHINQKELDKLKNSKFKNYKTISQYYIRDNRLFELFFVLKILSIFKIKKNPVNRKQIESDYLKKTQSINNNNWRNAFISLSSLGFIDNNNYPTEFGSRCINMEFSDFAYMMFDSYIKPYFQEIFRVLKNKGINYKNNEIANKIKENNENRDVLYLTDSNSRYISSWLNILRDDFGIIEFKSQQTERKILLDPFETQEHIFKDHIKQKSTYNIYQSKYEEILRNENI